MLINITGLNDLIECLQSEAMEQIKLGRSNSSIKTRIDWVLSALHRNIGNSIPGNPDDFIIEVDL